MTRASLSLGVLLLAGLAALLGFVPSCESRKGPTLGTETNWLAPCTASDECRAGSCICGHCTASCSTNADCPASPSPDSCVTEGPALEGVCGGHEPLAGICLPTCSATNGCASGLSCVAGHCIPASGATDAGDAGACVARTPGVWTAMSSASAPTSSHYDADPALGNTTADWAFWSGSDLVVLAPLGLGGRYDPCTDAWREIPRDPFFYMLASDFAYPLVRIPSGVFYFDDPDADYFLDLSLSAWRAIALQPGLRNNEPASVWTGNELMRWGGWDSTYPKYLHPLAEGVAYDPAADVWQPISTMGAPAARVAQGSPSDSFGNVVAAGDKLFVWGGAPVSDPVFGTVTQGEAEAVALASAPGLTCADWKPEECRFGDGAIYDPAADAWTAVSTSGAPSARAEQTTVWTGTRVLVWGGNTFVLTSPGVTARSELSDGALYDPAADAWAPMAAIPNGLGASASRQPLWVAGRLVVIDSLTSTNAGAVYDPAANQWGMVSPTPDGSACDHAIASNGRIIHRCGAQLGLFDPVTNTWTMVPANTNTPTDPLNVWTGSEILQWGGWGYVPVPEDGGCTTPSDAGCGTCECGFEASAEGAVLTPALSGATD